MKTYTADEYPLVKHARTDARKLRKALTRSCFGESGMYVFAEDERGVEYRICSVRCKGCYVQAKKLGSGEWFNITWWSER